MVVAISSTSSWSVTSGVGGCVISRNVSWNVFQKLGSCCNVYCLVECGIERYIVVTLVLSCSLSEDESSGVLYHWIFISQTTNSLRRGFLLKHSANEIKTTFKTCTESESH